MPTAVAPTAPARNLELKLRVDTPALAAAEARLVAAGVPVARMRQVDTYFDVPRARLKLRRIDPDGAGPAAELIAYVRPDQAGPRWSAYHRAAVALAEAPVLAAALAATLGVLVVVAKVRRVGTVGRTRVHLDVVDGLGPFVELETVVGAGPDGDAEVELAATAALLGLDPAGGDGIAESYADLLLAAGANGRTDASAGDPAGAQRKDEG